VPQPGVEPSRGTGESPRATMAPEPAPIDLIELAGGGRLKTYGAIGLGVLAALLVFVILRRRR